MSSSPLHLMHFEGGDALAAFRAQALLGRLRAVCPRVNAVTARFVHWVAFDAAPDAAAASTPPAERQRTAVRAPALPKAA